MLKCKIYLPLIISISSPLPNHLHPKKLQSNPICHMREGAKRVTHHQIGTNLFLGTKGFLIKTKNGNEKSQTSPNKEKLEEKELIINNSPKQTYQKIWMKTSCY